MAQTTKDDLKKYFETGDKPTQTEYAELIDAFRHIDTKLPISDVESLQASLDSKAAATTLLNHINDDSVHSSQLNGAEIKTAYEAELDTNAFTDAEKQQVADSVTHSTDTASHVTTTDKTKWNNQVANYSSGEVFTDDMGSVIRIGTNYRMYQLVATRPFTTSDLFTEAEENPKKWQILGTSFPSFELTSISRTQLSPDTTTDLFIRGLLVTGLETISIGNGIVTINNVSFRKIDTEPVMVANITTPTTLHDDLEIVIDNGTPKTLSETFTVSNGLEYIPSPTNPDAMFVINQGDASDVILGDGSIRNLNGVSGQKVIKVDLDVPADKDFLVEWDVTTNNNGETSEGDIGLANKIAPATGRGSIRYAWYHQGANHDYYYNYSNFLAQGIGGNTGGSYKLKGTLNTSGLYDVEWIQDNITRWTLSNQAADEVLNMFFTTNSLTSFENIKMTII